MCKTSSKTLYESCNHTVYGPVREHKFCIYGRYCEKVNHVAHAFQRVHDRCPTCKNGRSHSRVGGTKIGNGVKRFAPTDADKKAIEDKIKTQIQTELRHHRYFDQTKGFLYFLLGGHPSWVNQGNMITVFGQETGGWYTEAQEAHLVAIAEKRGYDVYLKPSLQAARVSREASQGPEASE